MKKLSLLKLNAQRILQKEEKKELEEVIVSHGLVNVLEIGKIKKMVPLL